MKKIIILFLFTTLYVNAQESSISAKNNEFRVDVFSAIAFGRISLSYERFLGKNFSVNLNANFSNSNKIQNEFDGGSRNNLSKYEFNPSIRYALSKGKSSYYFVEMFTSANGGDYKEIIRAIDENGNGYYTTQFSKYTDFALGGGLGYKMYFKKAYAVELLVGFGKNLTNTIKSPDIISRVGINLGYRF